MKTAFLACGTALFLTMGCAGSMSPEEDEQVARAITAQSSRQAPLAPRLAIDFDFDGGLPPIADLIGSGADSDGDSVSTGQSWDGSRAIRFPSSSVAGDGESLAIVVAPDAAKLSPGDEPFSFGADVRLYPHSSGASDNGDNVMQRGLYGETSQFKLQVDNRRPSCVVRGVDGDLSVKATGPLEAGWYRLACERSAMSVSLTVTPIEDGRLGVPDRVEEVGRVGSVLPSGHLSIGAKTNPDGVSVPQNSDQFNGLIDNVWVKCVRC